MRCRIDNPLVFWYDRSVSKMRSNVMQLSWSDQDRLAEALWAAYPEQDRLALDSEALRRLIVALPAFNDTPEPPGKPWLDKILWTWMRIADERAAAAGAGDAAECASPPCFAGCATEGRS
jgi:FeS assembly protein IscX